MKFPVLLRLCTALSATIGTGNIVGVATAVCAGGPGALVLDDRSSLLWNGYQIFRRSAGSKISCGCRKMDTVLGGPFYYIEKGMGAKLEMARKDFCILWCMCRFIRYWYIQPGKWYLQCSTELL